MLYMLCRFKMHLQPKFDADQSPIDKISPLPLYRSSFCSFPQVSSRIYFILQSRKRSERSQFVGIRYPHPNRWDEMNKRNYSATMLDGLISIVICLLGLFKRRSSPSGNRTGVSLFCDMHKNHFSSYHSLPGMPFPPTPNPFKVRFEDYVDQSSENAGKPNACADNYHNLTSPIISIIGSGLLNREQHGS